MGYLFLTIFFARNCPAAGHSLFYALGRITLMIGEQESSWLHDVKNWCVTILKLFWKSMEKLYVNANMEKSCPCSKVAYKLHKYVGLVSTDYCTHPCACCNVLGQNSKPILQPEPFHRISPHLTLTV